MVVISIPIALSSHERVITLYSKLLVGSLSYQSLTPKQKDWTMNALLQKSIFALFLVCDRGATPRVVFLLVLS